jgi:hypothetical protein
MITLFYHLLKVIDLYNRTKAEAKAIRQYLKIKWEKTKI